MLPEALDYLASLDVMHNKFIDRITKASRQVAPTVVARTPNVTQSAIVTTNGKIVYPRNFIDDVVQFLQTPFSNETKQLLRYQRAVIP